MARLCTIFDITIHKYVFDSCQIHLSVSSLKENLPVMVRGIEAHLINRFGNKFYSNVKTRTFVSNF